MITNTNSFGEWIEIQGLELMGRIGVPEQERSHPQRLVISLRYQIGAPFSGLNDCLEKTVDYFRVAGEVKKVVESTQARLIETLVSEICDALLARFAINRIEIELRKFILSNAEYVSVRLEKSRE